MTGQRFSGRTQLAVCRASAAAHENLKFNPTQRPIGAWRLAYSRASRNHRLLSVLHVVCRFAHSH